MKHMDTRGQISVIGESIGYFVAGGFVINIMLPSLSMSFPPNLPQFSKCLTFVFGLFLLGVAFIFVVSTFIGRKGFISFSGKLRIWAFPMLFAVSVTMLLPALLNFRENTVFLITTIVFGVIIVYAIIFASKNVFQDISSLATLIVVFNGFAIYLVVSESGVIGVATILTVSIVSCLRLFHLVNRKEGDK